MIVIGYHKIGKSVICKDNDKYIDLDPKKLQIVEEEDKCISKSMPYGWEATYAKTAEMLSKQGYVVFISPDKQVVELLGDSKEVIVYIYPNYCFSEKFVRERIIDADDELSERMIEILISSCRVVSTHMHNIAIWRLSMTYPTDIYELNKLDFDLNDIINKALVELK